MKNIYGDFSEYYDLLGWNQFARNSAVRLQSFFKLRGDKPRAILDLACGSGELEWALRASDIKFTGVDISPGMIKVARKKFPGGDFIVGDAATIRMKKKFDMALLLFDSANHMSSLSQLLKVFRNARRHLAPNGFFIFDFLTETGLSEWEQINIKRTKSYTLFYYGHYYPEKHLADVFIEAFIKKPGRNNYHRIFQKIVEKTYPASDIIDGLVNSGFTRITASPFDLDEKIEKASRIWFVCRS